MDVSWSVLQAKMGRERLAALLVVACTVADAARKARMRRKRITALLLVTELIAVGALVLRQRLFLQRGTRHFAHCLVRIHIMERRQRHADRQLIKERDGERARIAFRAEVNVEGWILERAANGARAALIPVAALVLLKGVATGRVLAVKPDGVHGVDETLRDAWMHAMRACMNVQGAIGTHGARTTHA